MNYHSTIICLPLLISAFLSCSGNRAILAEDRVILKDNIRLEKGHSITLDLDPGTYRLELKSSGDGVSIEWQGTSCQKIEKTKSVKTVCRFIQKGQLSIGNTGKLGFYGPSPGIQQWGMSGKSQSVTLKLIKFARDK